MKRKITKTKLHELCKEFNLRYYESEDDYLYIDFKDVVITDDYGSEGSLLTYGWQDYVYAKAGLQLWYDAIDNRMKIIWVDEEVSIDNMEILKKYCKNMIEQYEQFKLCKKQFKQNTRIKNISKDF